MAEYIKYRGNEIKIGDGENLYYTSHQKYNRALNKGLLSGLPGQVAPEHYLRNSTVVRFRFPFPDEDKLPFGSIGSFPFDRGVQIKVNSQGNSRWEEQLKLLAGNGNTLEITQQKLAFQYDTGKFLLALVVRNPNSQNCFRIEDEYLIDRLNEDIMRNHIVRETDPKRKKFYRQLSARILNGYRQDIKVPHVIYRSKRTGNYLSRGRRI